MASGTINGTVSNLATRFSFYVTWASYKEDGNKRHRVVVTSIIQTNNVAYDFDTVGTRNHWIVCNGETRNLSRRIDCSPDWPYGNPLAIQQETFYVPYGDPGVKVISIDAYVDGSASSYGPSACNIAATNVSLDNVPETGAFTPSNISESVVRGTLSGITPYVSFARTIYWYIKKSTASSYTLAGTTTVSAGSGVTSYAFDFTGLTPGLTYDMIADVYNGGTHILRTSGSRTLGSAAGSVSYGSKLETGITLTVSGLQANPGFTKVLTWQYKKHADSAWITFATDTIASSGTTSHAKAFTGLQVNNAYDFRCVISTGGDTYLTLSQLNLDFPQYLLDLPVAVISNIVQVPFTDIVRIYWIANDASPNARFQAYADDVAIGELMTEEPPAYSEFTISTPGEYDFKIVTTNTGVGGSATSSIYTFIVVETDFVFAETIAAGQPLVSAAEWNRFLAWIIAKAEALSITFTEAQDAAVNSTMISGYDITAAHFNLVKAALNSSMNDKIAGDVILANDFLQLEGDLNALV